jgi:hypothetical protein
VSVTLCGGDSAHEQNIPATLADAHEVVWCQRPARDADPQAWVDFHRNSALVYSRTASVDVGCRREALLCAGMEIRKAREIEHRLDPGLDGDE